MESRYTNFGRYNDDNTTENVYRIRWLVLIVFFSHILYANTAWTNIDSIADLAECYYNVDVFWINSLSYVFFVTYLLLFTFATWFLDKFGLKWAAIVSGCLSAAGAWIKFTGAGPEYFWLLLPGQALSSMPSVIEWSAPALLSAVWFPPNERALATTLVGAIAPQSGILISLVLGPILFKDPQDTTICSGASSHHSIAYDEWQSSMYSKMYYYLMGQAIFATLMVPLSFVIPATPPIPPSVSEHVRDGINKLTVAQSMFSLLKNFKFLLFLLVFGILQGVAAVYVTVYEEVLSHTGYSRYESDMSYLGLSIQVVAIVLLIAVGKWIDCTKTFYLSSVFICFGSTMLSCGFAIAVLLKLHFYVICILCTLSNSFVTMIQGVGYEYGVEMTFPVQEAVSTGLLNAMSRFIAIILTIPACAIIKTHTVYVLFFLAGFLILALLIQVFVKPKLQRIELESASSGVS